MPYFFLLFWISKICFILQTDAEKMYMMFKVASNPQNCKPSLMQCGLCRQHTNSFKILSSEDDSVGNSGFVNMDLATRTKVRNFGMS